jgi:hypothetical protein
MYAEPPSLALDFGEVWYERKYAKLLHGNLFGVAIRALNAPHVFSYPANAIASTKNIVTATQSCGQ